MSANTHGDSHSRNDYPLLAYYRSQHSNQSWLAALTAILDSSALIVAGIEGMPSEQAQLTFAMARHTLVDVTQIFVPRYAPGAPDRLDAGALRRLREQLAEASIRVPDSPEFVERLTALRKLYEPYAQALAAHLMLDLPGWLPAEGHRDNWRGGPWDRRLGTRDAVVFPGDEHF